MGDTDTVRSGPARLREWRSKRGFSQGDAAAKINVRQAMWSEWEQDDVKRGPNRDMAIRIEALTDGAVPIESWSLDPLVVADMERVIRHRVEQHGDSAAAMSSTAAAVNDEHEAA